MATYKRIHMFSRVQYHRGMNIATSFIEKKKLRGTPQKVRETPQKVRGMRMTF